MNSKRDLIFYLPVIHKGYLDFLRKNEEVIEKIFILDDSLLTELSTYRPIIAAISPVEAGGILASLGWKNIVILTKDNLLSEVSEKVLLIQDDVSRELAGSYLKDKDIKWESVFLRWDRSKVLSTDPIEGSEVDDLEKQRIMETAYRESGHSSDWWRQVGAVLVVGGQNLKSYNQALPSDHEPYQRGAIRDYLEVGERPDLSNTIHAEQKIIAEAAKRGVKLEGSALYVTHFPCAVCAKIIACSGIGVVYFAEGSSNLEGSNILESASVDVIKVKMKDPR